MTKIKKGVYAPRCPFVMLKFVIKTSDSIKLCKQIVTPENEHNRPSSPEGVICI